MKTVYGIDLGTTFSSISHINDRNEPEVIANPQGETIIPSVVLFQQDIEGLRVIVGTEAKRQAPFFPRQIAAFTKQHTGTKTTFFILGEHYRFEEISAYILKKLVRDAEQMLQTKIKHVVITVPAHFGEQERQATRLAGQLIGLNVIEIINEPTAAAIAYGYGEKMSKRVLVYDLGGGTFDVTIIDISEKGIEVIATDGNHRLGGKDWDDALIDYFLFQLEEQAHIFVELEQNLVLSQTLRALAEQTKKALSIASYTPVSFEVNGVQVQFNMTLDTFNDITLSLLNSTLTRTDNVIKLVSERDHKAIDEIILVGGMTKMQQIRHSLQQRYQLEPKFFKPDEAVALGAARYAHHKGLQSWLNPRNTAQTKLSAKEKVMLFESKQMSTTPTDYGVKNVSPNSYGIRFFDPQRQQHWVRNLIFKNNALPASATIRLGTYYEGQLSVQLDVMENKMLSPMAEITYAKKIGHIHFPLPRNLPVATPIEVTLTVEENGLLNIQAVDIQTNTKKAFTIQNESMLQMKELEPLKRKIAAAHLI